MGNPGANLDSDLPERGTNIPKRKVEELRIYGNLATSILTIIAGDYLTPIV